MKVWDICQPILSLFGSSWKVISTGEQQLGQCLAKGSQLSWKRSGLVLPNLSEFHLYSHSEHISTQMISSCIRCQGNWIWINNQYLFCSFLLIRKKVEWNQSKRTKWSVCWFFCEGQWYVGLKFVVRNKVPVDFRMISLGDFCQPTYYIRFCFLKHSAPLCKTLLFHTFWRTYFKNGKFIRARNRWGDFFKTQRDRDERPNDLYHSATWYWSKTKWLT